MVTTLYLIRHGETVGSEVKRYKGSIDVPLSEQGIVQMKAVSAFIARNAKLSVVYCSPLSRAVKSAEIIAGPYGLKPQILPDLRERSFGIWEGMTFTEIKERYPAAFEAWASNPLQHSPIDGESTIEAGERAIKALDTILNRHSVESEERRSSDDGEGDHIAIVAHGGVNRIILCHILGIPFENIFRIEQDHAAINIIEFWERYPVVKLINGVSPLLGGV